MKPKVKIAITGSRPREVYFLPTETLSDLCHRLHSPSWPLISVDNWYCNGEATEISPRKTPLQDGFTYAGTPRIGGACAINLKLYGWEGFLKFQKGDTLYDALMTAPLHVKAAAAKAIGWHFWSPGGSLHSTASASTFELKQGMTVQALSVRATLLGYGGSVAFPIEAEETLERFLGRGSNKFPLWETKRFYTFGTDGKKNEVHNPGHFELKPGMQLFLEPGVVRPRAGQTSPKTKPAGHVKFAMTGKPVKLLPFNQGERFWDFIHRQRAADVPIRITFYYNGGLITQHDNPALKDFAVILGRPSSLRAADKDASVSDAGHQMPGGTVELDDYDTGPGHSMTFFVNETIRGFAARTRLDIDYIDGVKAQPAMMALQCQDGMHFRGSFR